MKKIVASLFLSLVVSLLNAATMPVDLSGVSSSVMASNHDHCQEATPASHHEASKSNLSSNTNHYCCAVVAVLMTPSVFSASKQVDVHVLVNATKPASTIAESIFKPPRKYL